MKIIIGMLILSILVFYHYAPILGEKIDTARFKNVDNFNGKNFENKYSVKENITIKEKAKDSGWLLKMLSPEGKLANRNIKINKVTSEEWENASDNDVLWFGHSTLLMKKENKNIMIDPVFAERPSPVPFFIKKRFSNNFVMDKEDLPNLDLVLITHDHYDHLDYKTIQDLDHKIGNYIVPLGVEQHLIKWGVEKDKIISLTWWEHYELEGLKVHLTPSEHFSGRRFTKNNTLWGGYLFETKTDNIYFSGDTGYGSHFKEIKNRFGKIDFAFLESGQYNANWSDIHMLPRQTVKAAQDLGVKEYMPIHWGMFVLSTHNWNDPVIRMDEEIKNKNLKLSMIVPEIGEPLNVLKIKYKNTNDWWK